ncbi:hypothetical protein BH10PSE3_BH10PSE3_00710 [soil metagenome]
MPQVLGSTNSQPITVSDGGMIFELLDNALRLFEGDRASARQLVEQAFTLADRSMRPVALAQGALASWQVRRIEAYISENLCRPIRIETVAGLLPLSASYFSRVFKATFGSTFSHYVICQRIALAKQMLLTTDAPIAEIALDCGLADQSHLTRLFTRIVGSPPNAWRRAARCKTWPSGRDRGWIPLDVDQTPSDSDRDGVRSVAYG